MSVREKIKDVIFFFFFFFAIKFTDPLGGQLSMDPRQRTPALNRVLWNSMSTKCKLLL